MYDTYSRSTKFWDVRNGVKFEACYRKASDAPSGFYIDNNHTLIIPVQGVKYHLQTYGISEKEWYEKIPAPHDFSYDIMSTVLTNLTVTMFESMNTGLHLPGAGAKLKLWPQSVWRVSALWDGYGPTPIGYDYEPIVFTMP
jgi:hypothetical protein